MNEQNIPQANEPVQSSKHIWITVIAVVLTAIIVGGGIYTWQKSNLRSTEQSLQQQITELQNQIPNLQEPTQPIVTNQEKPEEPTQPADETSKIIQEISTYCEKYNIPECLPVTSYSIVDLDNKFAVVKIGNFNYLLTQKKNDWNVSIVSQENNICETGSGNTDLVEYCKQ